MANRNLLAALSTKTSHEVNIRWISIKSLLSEEDMPINWHHITLPSKDVFEINDETRSQITRYDLTVTMELPHVQKTIMNHPTAAQSGFDYEKTAESDRFTVSIAVLITSIVGGTKVLLLKRTTVVS